MHDHHQRRHRQPTPEVAVSALHNRSVRIQRLARLPSLRVDSGKAYYQDIVEFPTDDIEAYCATYQGETLFIHGTNDMAVYYGYSVRANELYPNSSLISIPGAVHGFTGEDEKKAQYEFFSKE